MDNKTNLVVEFLKKAIQGSEYDGFVYYVGGWVRDKLMGRQSNDIDLLIDLPNGEFEFTEFMCNTFPSECGNRAYFHRFGTSRFEVLGEQVECVIPRCESYCEENGRKPDVTQSTIEVDVLRRDFTVNSLLMCVSTGSILDLTGQGIDDIRNKIIRCVGDPMLRFDDDPLRLLRAVRQSAQLGFAIDEETEIAIITKCEKLNSISVERIRDEFNKMLLLPKPSIAIRKLENLFLLDVILPELIMCLEVKQNHYHKDNVYNHTLDVLDKTPSDLKVRLAALFHDVGKPACKTSDTNGNIHFYKHEIISSEMAENIMRTLKYSKEYVNDVSFIVKNHMRVKSFDEEGQAVKDKSIRKLVHELGPRRDMVFELIDADNKSHHPDYSLPRQIDGIRNRINELGYSNTYKIVLPLNGNDIMEHFNIGPSKDIAKMLEFVRKTVYSNPLLTKEQALKLVSGNFKNSVNGS